MANPSPGWDRDAAIAAGVAAFLLIFRPFGLTLNNPVEWLVVAGVAPLNFVLIQLVHRLPSVLRGPRRLLAVALIAGCNLLWFWLWSGSSIGWGLSLKVAAVAGLVVLVISLWRREQVAQRAADAARRGERPRLVLRGASDQEILRLNPEELLYLHAEGNYVEVGYLRDGEPATSLLRSSLKGMADQVPEGLLLPCHRSWMVNLTQVQRVVRRDQGLELDLGHDAVVPVSRSHRDVLLTAAGLPRV